MAEAVHSSQLVRFETFEVDLRTGELRKAGVHLKLAGQPFQVLAILLEQPGEVVTREELQKRLWPDTFVDFDHNLNTAINKIREALGDSAERPRFVETLPRRGYRFIAPMEDLKPPIGLEQEAGGNARRAWSPRSWALRGSILFAAVVLLAILVVKQSNHFLVDAGIDTKAGLGTAQVAIHRGVDLGRRLLPS